MGTLDTIERLTRAKQRAPRGMLKLSSYYFLPDFIPLRAFDIALIGKDSWNGIKNLLSEFQPPISLPDVVYNHVNSRFEAWARFVNRQIHKVIADKNDPLISEALSLYHMNPAMNRGPVVFGLMMYKLDWFRHVVINYIAGHHIVYGDNILSFYELIAELVEDDIGVAEMLGYQDEIYWSGLALVLLKESVFPVLGPSGTSLCVEQKQSLSKNSEFDVLSWLFRVIAVQDDEFDFTDYDDDGSERYLTGFEVLKVFFKFSGSVQSLVESQLTEAGFSATPCCADIGETSQAPADVF